MNDAEKDIIQTAIATAQSIANLTDSRAIRGMAEHIAASLDSLSQEHEEIKRD